MRKLAAISIILLFLFNAGGYQLLHAYIQHQADISFENKLDKHSYDETELVAIKVPSSSLPYSSFSSRFERVNGEIEMNGKQYRFVERRIFNDSLEFLCIPDLNSTQLRLAKNNFFKLVNDLQGTAQEKKSDSSPHIYKIFAPDFCSLDESFSIQGPSSVSAFATANHSGKPDPVYLSPAGQPPDAA